MIWALSEINVILLLYYLSAQGAYNGADAAYKLIGKSHFMRAGNKICNEKVEIVVIHHVEGKPAKGLGIKAHIDR